MISNSEETSRTMQHPPRPVPASWYYWTPPAVALILLTLLFLEGGNQALFLAVNRLSRFTGDTLWADLTILGDGTVALAMTLLFVRRRPDVVVAVVIAALMTTLAVNGLKSYFHLPRPPAVLAAGAFHVIGPAYHSRSFPSGHTATAFAFAGIMCLTFARPWLNLVLLAAACAVGVSRVVVGVHWPADVLAGAAVGWLCAAAAFSLAARWPPGPAWRRTRPLLSIPLYIAALLLWWPDITPYTDALPLQYALAGVTLAGGAAAVPRLMRGDG